MSAFVRWNDLKGPFSLVFSDTIETAIQTQTPATVIYCQIEFQVRPLPRKRGLWSPEDFDVFGPAFIYPLERISQ